MKVAFFPRNDYPNAVSICNNRWNKQMTYADFTDGIYEQASFMPIILWGFRYGIRTGCHISRYPVTSWPSDVQLIKPLSKVGIIRAGLISCIDQSTGEYLPRYDYTQQEYNDYVDAEDEWFLPNIGYVPSTVTQYAQNSSYLPLTQEKLVAGRYDNPPAFNTYTWNGLTFPGKVSLGNPPNTPFSRLEQTRHNITMRWFSLLGSEEYQSAEQVMAVVREGIRITKNNSGFYANFDHWHQEIGDHRIIGEPPYSDKGVTYDTIEDYYAGISEESNGDVHFCSYSEAMEYAIARTMIKRIAMYSPIKSPNKVVFVTEFENNYDIPVPINKFRTPLSAVIDLSNTPLAGKYIKLNIGNFISLGNDRYVIDIPCPTYGLMTQVIISESNVNCSTPTTAPIVTFDGTNFHSDKKVNIVVFKKSVGYGEERTLYVDSALGVTNYTLTNREKNYLYAVGAITDYNKTALTEWI